MLKRAVLLIVVLFPVMAICQQRDRKASADTKRSDVLSQASSDKKNKVASINDTVATIDMYRIITLDRDTTYIDTSLTIQKEYTANYLRKDNFGLLQFPNEGQPYNLLDFGRVQHNPFPQFGFRAKHFAYMEVDDINYYSVATPFTDLFYRSVLEQGQMLDAFVTVNTSENLNHSVAYKGLRSLGKYINNLSSNGNFRFTTAYNTKNRRYFLNLHITAQDFSNQENGGIVATDLFEEGKDPYTERERLEVFFNNATSMLRGNRYFFDHTFRLSRDNPNSIVLHHQFNYENKYFEFLQATPHPRLGPSYKSVISNKTRHNRMYNKLGVAYSNETVGAIEFYVEDFNYNYYYKSLILDSNGNVDIPNQLNDRINTYGARYSYHKKKLKGSVLVSNSITDQSLADIDINARYTFDDNNSLSFRYQNMNKLPNQNFNLYQSDYINYNWHNDFKNEKINNIEFEAKTQWLSAAVQYTVLNDHLYFSNDFVYADPEAPEMLLVTPKQYGNTINYFSARAGREFRYGKFALDNTLLYQNVDQDDNIINVPEFTTRNTLYYSDYFFKKALFVQTGITFQYFTEYYANDYNPVLGEFFVQDRKKIGNFPLMDFFINAKIKQFRLFLKAEHFNSSFTGYDFYSAPNYPYRDFTIRLGVIWDFFS